MQVSLTIPDDVATELGLEGGDLGRRALEADTSPLNHLVLIGEIERLAR